MKGVGLIVGAAMRAFATNKQGIVDVQPGSPEISANNLALTIHLESGNKS